MLTYTGRLGLVHRLVAMLQDDGTTRVSYQGPSGSDAPPDVSTDATETVLLAVRLGPGPDSLAHVRTKVDEFLRRHQGVTVSVEEQKTPGPPHPTALVGDLESLARLHADGQLSDEEFRRAKQRLLGT
jgi:putative oligomerization/nucleic acid binding protein